MKEKRNRTVNTAAEREKVAIEINQHKVNIDYSCFAKTQAEKDKLKSMKSDWKKRNNK